MDKHRIRLNSTESVNSVNKDNKVAVELQQTTKPYYFTNSIREEIDQYEVFKQERDNCTKYRLITTIKPYCSNILFNPVTEIVKREGSDDTKVITDNNMAQDTDSAMGIQQPRRLDMIRNTEYSQKGLDYEYHPGYDMFNNHLLRSKSFKIVNPITSTTSYVDSTINKREIFNTIRDILRRYDGQSVKFTNRTSLSDVNPIENDKHLYDNVDLYEIDEAINNNLVEDNGWVGFVNKTSVISKTKVNTDTVNHIVEWEDENFNHIINSKESCYFVDMYPDRTLYSFNPKYNIHQHRPEYNWNIYLTYPYKNFYNHELIKDVKIGLNAILIQEVRYVSGITGQDTILFKTFFKHNLQGGSTINLYYKPNKSAREYHVIENVVISDIGNLDKNNNDFFFYTTDTRILDELNVEQKGNIDGVFRFVNVINGYESEYYIRLFRKLPNLLKSKKIEEKDLINKETLENYIKNDCNSEFDKEIYRLGFSNTIYNDNNTQITFTDGIEINNLFDNRGRPLTEIFLTIVKNNKGNHIWYENNEEEINKNYKEIEYSHCFSDVSQGFDLFFDENSSLDEHICYSNIRVMHTGIEENNQIKYNRFTEDNNFFGWGYLPNIDKDIVSIGDDFFVGDIVEYNSIICNEIVLSEGQFRFNSFLRDNPDYTKYSYNVDEMESDDYDLNDFKINEIRCLNNEDLFHPEGYYYKSHYPIKLREWGELNQASHFDLRIKSAKKVNIGNRIYVVIKTTLPHRLDTSDTLLICYDKEDKIMKMNPSYIFDELTFAIGDYMVYNTDIKEYETKLSASDICDIINNIDNKYENIIFKLRKYNDEIPYYATKTVNKNRYMWRTLNNVGNKDNNVLNEYPYANNYFYVNQDINFYLKRQDPFGELGLYYYGNKNSIIPNDIFGNVSNPSNYEYKEENEATC